MRVPEGSLQFSAGAFEKKWKQSFISSVHRLGASNDFRHIHGEDSGDFKSRHVYWREATVIEKVI
jgi:hypothetical protein